MFTTRQYITSKTIYSSYQKIIVCTYKNIFIYPNSLQFQYIRPPLPWWHRIPSDKQGKVRLVLAWGTSWEVQMLYTFALFCFFLLFFAFLVFVLGIILILLYYITWDNREPSIKILLECSFEGALAFAKVGRSSEERGRIMHLQIRMSSVWSRMSSFWSRMSSFWSEGIQRRDMISCWLVQVCN